MIIHDDNNTQITLPINSISISFKPTSGGLRRLDVLVEIGGQQVERADDAQRIIYGASIGEVRFAEIIFNDFLLNQTNQIHHSLILHTQRI